MSKGKRLYKTLSASVDYFFSAAGVVAVVIGFAGFFANIGGEISFPVTIGTGLVYGCVGCRRRWKEIVLKEEQEKLEIAEAQEAARREKEKTQMFIDMGNQVKQTLAVMESKNTPASSKVEEPDIDFKPSPPERRASSKRKLHVTVGPGTSPSLVQFKLSGQTIRVATQAMRPSDSTHDRSPSPSATPQTGARELRPLTTSFSTGAIHAPGIFTSAPTSGPVPTPPAQRSGSEVPLRASASSDSINAGYGGTKPAMQ